MFLQYSYLPKKVYMLLGCALGYALQARYGRLYAKRSVYVTNTDHSTEGLIQDWQHQVIACKRAATVIRPKALPSDVQVEGWGLPGMSCVPSWTVLVP